MTAAQQTVDAGGPYILQAAALGLGLELDVGRRPQVVEPKPRRPSLSQRLGLQPAGERAASPSSEASARTPSPPSADGASGSPKPASPAGAKQRAAKIECIDAVGNDVYVGTSHGQIVHFTTETPEVGSGRAPDHFRVQAVDLKLGGKRVEQILAFPAMCRLVVLCGSSVVFYSLPELRPVASSAMPTIKGVSCIAYDERAQRSTAATAVLCVARMREIRLYRIGADLKLEQEVPIDCSVASICQYGGFVCLADTETYKILDLAKARTGPREDAQLVLLPTQQPRTDAETGRVVRPPRPRTLVVGPNEFMFLAPSGDDATLGVMVTALGEALRGTLQFATYPKSVVYDHPYIVAAFGTGQVDVYDTRSPEQALAQTFFAGADAPPDARRQHRLCAVASLRACTLIAQPDVIDVSDSIADAAACPDGVVAGSVFDPRNLQRLAGCDFEAMSWTDVLGPGVHWRREALGDAGTPAPSPGAGRALSQWLEARVAVFSNDAVHALVVQPQLARVEALVREQRIEEAVVAVESALAADPGLDPRAGEVAYCFQLAGMACLKHSLLDDALQHLRRGELDPRALLHLLPDYVGYLGPLLVPFGRIPMPAGLRQLFYEIGSVERLVERGAQQLAGGTAEQQAAVGATLQANVLEMLQRYLEFCRLQMQQDDQPFAPDAIPVIDTSLARVYAITNAHDRLVRLIRGPNSIVGDLACGYFCDAHHYYYCGLVYKAQGDSARVLDVWRRLLRGEWHDSRFGGMPEYLEYAAALDSQAVLLAEYYWLAGFDADASLALLARLTDATVATVDADRVIGDIEAQGDRPLRLFIERLIGAKHGRATHYVTYLAKAYVRQIRDYYLADTVEARGRASALETQYRCAQAESLSLTLRDHLRAVRSRDEGTELRAQLLLDVLCTRPPSYDPAAVLECIETEAAAYLGVERAVLLVVLGRADDALELLVYGCAEYAEAELLLLQPRSPRSLARLGPARPEEPPSSSSVRHLLAMYLQVAETDDDTAARLVVDILSRYFGYVDADVLAQIPDHWPYTAVEPFVRRHLETLARDERASQVERSLGAARAHDDVADAADAVVDHGPIALDYSQTCAACKKLLGSAAFVYAPDTRQITHVSCTKL
ncbi:hypothetical protein H4R19_000382 [Coemansia spiralis]|nr:hypothetical protein H4R19_000382 [Coemansia spiralis]